MKIEERREAAMEVAEEAGEIANEILWALKRLPQLDAERQEMRDACCRAFAVLNAPEHDDGYARRTARAILRAIVWGDRPSLDGLEKLGDEGS